MLGYLLHSATQGKRMQNILRNYVWYLRLGILEDFRAECVPEKRRSWQAVRLGTIAAQAAGELAQLPPMPTQRKPGSSASRCATSLPDSVTAALPICRKVVACTGNESGQRYV